MWVRKTEPRCRMRDVTNPDGSITSRFTNVPTEALIFCSARRVKDAPSTYCDAARILHWRSAITTADHGLVLCHGLRGRGKTLIGRVASSSAIAETVSATVDGTTYFALYLRNSDEVEDPRAKASIHTICPLATSA